MAHFVRPNEEELRSVGLDDLVGSKIGVFWSRELQVETEATDYLRWKATGLWRSKSMSAYSSLSRPSANTIKGSSADLVNFLDWCESRHVDWRNLSYINLVDHYQGEMTSGRWNLLRKGCPLAPSTINRRLLTVCDFLEFAAGRGWRGPIAVQTEPVRHPTAPGKTTRARVGRVRRNPKELRLPTLAELNDWMSEVKSQSGFTAYLMVKTAISVALRAEEIVLLRAEQLPELPSDGGRKSARLLLKYGTKGKRDYKDPNKEGKNRFVRVPVDLLSELHAYKKLRRRLSLSRLEAENPDHPVPEELFLLETKGTGFSYDWFHEIWTSAKPLPFEGFSPHHARHIWACYTLLDKIKQHMELSNGISGPLENVARAMHETLITTYIKPQLGHISEETTENYLNWVVGGLEGQDKVESWVEFLNG